MITIDQPCKLSYVIRSKIFLDNFSTNTVNISVLNCTFFENYNSNYPTDSEGNYVLEIFYKTVVENITEINNHSDSDSNPLLEYHNFDMRYIKVDSYILIKHLDDMNIINGFETTLQNNPIQNFNISLYVRKLFYSREDCTLSF